MSEFRRTGKRETLYLEAAGGVISQYLQRNYFAPDADEFLGSRDVDANDNISYRFPLHVIQIGETLFLLRNCEGFNEICHRLKTKSLRVAYYEMCAAKMFFKAGFDIQMRPEQGRLGQVFDFSAVRKKLAVNVEVTALEEKEFNERTIYNAIDQERRQLPRDRPSVIVCIIPSQWEKIGVNLNEVTAQAAHKFFMIGNRRVNRLIFWVDR
jgi:hypothetical protein